jgi:hypothetical protein
VKVTGKRIGDVVVFAWDVFRVYCSFVVEEEASQKTGNIVMASILHWIEGGMVEPTCSAATVSEGEDMRVDCWVCVVSDG